MSTFQVRCTIIKIYKTILVFRYLFKHLLLSCFSVVHLYLWVMIHRTVMKRKFKKWWSTISSISTKRKITSHLKIIEITKIQRSHAQSFNFLWPIALTFVLFLLVIVLSVLIRFMASDCSFCIFKIVFEIFKMYCLYFF